MGTNTNGVLFYGFDCGETEPWADYDADNWDELAKLDWEAVYCTKKGLPERPEGDYRDPPVEAWRAARKALLAETGVIIDTHCSGSYPMYFVALKECSHSACRGYPVALKAEDLAVPADAEERLRAFCETLGIEYQEPAWHLASYWSS